MPALPNGYRHGMMVVVEDLGLMELPGRWKKPRMAVRIKCDCGNEKIVMRHILTCRMQDSCGCLRNKAVAQRMFKHGGAIEYKSTPEYRAYRHIKERCYNHTTKGFKRYGGRGVKMCHRWLKSYLAFLEDMGARPSSKHSIDRINNDGDYEPGNCRWSTWEVQLNNTSRVRLVTYKGKRQSIAMWARELGLKPQTLGWRLTRWSLDRAMKAKP